MAANGEDPMTKNKSGLRDFIGTVATMSGDLSNITAPPFVLDTKSTVEIPSYWAENSGIFCSPATAEDPAERALLVLRSFLSGIKSQCFMGKAPGEGLKKPLNAFLGELFIARWDGDHGTTRMVSEQVSHHPPITACRIWNEEYGVVTESFNRSSISMSTSVNVESTGVVLKTIEKYNETYLLPIPNFSVKSLLSTPSPYLSGTYYIPSSNGYMSVVHFAEKTFFGSSSQTHTFVAHVYKETESEKNPLYTIEGAWDNEFKIYDAVNKQNIETFNVQSKAIDAATKMIIDPVDKQDPWESRNAWRDVLAALKGGKMGGVNAAKNKLEEGQRQMRQEEEASGKPWEPFFFKPDARNPTIESLVAKIPSDDSRKNIVQGETFWMMDLPKWKKASKPYHKSLRPDNSQHGQSSTQSSQQDQPPERNEASQPATYSAPRQEPQPAVYSAPSQEPQPAIESAPSQQPQPVDYSAQNRGLYSGIYANDINHEVGAVKYNEPIGPQPVGYSNPIDHKVEAVDDRRSANIDGPAIDARQGPRPEHVQGIARDQPGPQVAQQNAREEQVGTGIADMSLSEKQQVENMLRDQYSSKPPKKKLTES